ncbi:MAG: MBL fold metallo-hydrolase, partial [archaeon]|nr:MBL fold metallo-hydrolase [archaeon]
YPVPQADAEVVTCSHNHYDHGYAEAIAGAPVVIRTAGTHKVSRIVNEGKAELIREREDIEEQWRHQIIPKRLL